MVRDCCLLRQRNECVWGNDAINSESSSKQSAQNLFMVIPGVQAVPAVGGGLQALDCSCRI